MTYHPVASLPGVIGFSILLLGAGAAFAFALKLRFSQVTQANRPEVRWNEIPARINNVLVYVIGQKRLPKNGYTYSGILHIFIFLFKTGLAVLFFMMIRWTLSRIRYDQNMRLGWKFLLPLALANIVVTGLVATAIYG